MSGRIFQHAKAKAIAQLQKAGYTRPLAYTAAVTANLNRDLETAAVDIQHGEALWGEVNGCWLYCRRNDYHFDFLNLVLEKFTSPVAIAAFIDVDPMPGPALTFGRFFLAMRDYLDVPPHEQLQRINAFAAPLLSWAQSSLDPRLQLDLSEPYELPTIESIQNRLLASVKLEGDWRDPDEKYIKLWPLPTTASHLDIIVINKPRTGRSQHSLFQETLEQKVLDNFDGGEAQLTLAPMPGVSRPFYLEHDHCLMLARLGDKIESAAKIGLAREMGGLSSHDGDACQLSMRALSSNRVQAGSLRSLSYFRGDICEHDGGTHEELQVALSYILNLHNLAAFTGYIRKQWASSLELIDKEIQLWRETKAESVGDEGSSGQATVTSKAEGSSTTLLGPHSKNNSEPLATSTSTLSKRNHKTVEVEDSEIDADGPCPGDWHDSGDAAEQERSFKRRRTLGTSTAGLFLTTEAATLTTAKTPSANERTRHPLSFLKTFHAYRYRRQRTDKAFPADNQMLQASAQVTQGSLSGRHRKTPADQSQATILPPATPPSGDLSAGQRTVKTRLRRRKPGRIAAEAGQNTKKARRRAKPATTQESDQPNAILQDVTNQASGSSDEPNRPGCATASSSHTLPPFPVGNFTFRS